MNPNKASVTDRLNKLRQLIQLEIDYAFQIENGYRFTHETRETNDRKWKDFEALFVELESDLAASKGDQ
jgi:hypothetical protein